MDVPTPTDPSVLSKIVETTPRWKLYCEYLVNDNSSKSAAARKAGYSPKSAPAMVTKLNRDPKVQLYIEKLRGIAAAKLEKIETEGRKGSESWVKMKLIDLAEQAMIDGNFSAAATALVQLSRPYPRLNGQPAPPKDDIEIPEGTSIDDLRSLRDDLWGKRTSDKSKYPFKDAS